MSLLLLLRNWLGGGEPPAPGQVYRLRAAIVMLNGPGATTVALANIRAAANPAATLAATVSHG